MTKIIDTATITREETDQLQEAWLSYQAMNELIGLGITNDAVLARYEKGYARYNKVWSQLLAKYFVTDYTKTSGATWACDFSRCLVTVSQG